MKNLFLAWRADRATFCLATENCRCRPGSLCQRTARGNRLTPHTAVDNVCAWPNLTLLPGRLGGRHRVRQPESRKGRGFHRVLGVGRPGQDLEAARRARSSRAQYQPHEPRSRVGQQRRPGCSLQRMVEPLSGRAAGLAVSCQHAASLGEPFLRRRAHLDDRQESVSTPHQTCRRDAAGRGHPVRRYSCPARTGGCVPLLTSPSRAKKAFSDTNKRQPDRACILSSRTTSRPRDRERR